MLRFRLFFQQNPKCCGAFDKWSVVLCTDKKKESNFERLLKAGGAKVLSVRPPFNSDIEATHAFLELNKVPLTTVSLKGFFSTFKITSFV